jgi:hypothetical protein
MVSTRLLGRHRVAVIAASVVSLSALTGGLLAVPALATGEDRPAALAAPAPQPAPNPAPNPAPKPASANAVLPLVPGTPCTITARSCVDLESSRAWLVKDGKVARGPVKISSGGNGKATPVGHSLRVYRKEKDHKSKESRLKNGQPAPMPYAVFFEDGGIAFHSGSPNLSSAGCIHLNNADAIAWFNFLQVGDQVQVVKNSQEVAFRKGKPVNTSAKPHYSAGDEAKSDDSGDSGDSGGSGDHDGDDEDHHPDDDD